MEFQNRAGYFMNSNTGYKSFVPAKLPPEPPIQYDAEMQTLLSLADRKLGRLDGITQILPNPELFVAMYVKKEAVLSSQIEGTQASFVDVLGAEYNHMLNASHKAGKDQFGYSVFGSVNVAKFADVYARFDDLYSKNDWNIAKDEQAAILGAQFKLGKYVKVAPNFRMNMPKAAGAKNEYSAYVNCYFGF